MIKSGYELSEGQIKAAYNRIAGEITMPDYFYPWVAGIARPQRGERLLDMGCGNGFFLEQLARDFPGTHLYGVELSPELTARAQERLGVKAKVQNAHADDLRMFSKHFFDVITMTEVIEHIKNPDEVLTQIRILLKKNGRAIITYPCGSLYKAFIPWVEKFPDNDLAKIFLPPEHPLRTFQPIDTVYFWKEMKDMLQRNGFQVSRAYGRESFRYLYEVFKLSRYNYKICPAVYKAIEKLDEILNRLRFHRLCYRIVLECRIVS